MLCVSVSSRVKSVKISIHGDGCRIIYFSVSNLCIKGHLIDIIAKIFLCRSIIFCNNRFIFYERKISTCVSYIFNILIFDNCVIFDDLITEDRFISSIFAVISLFFN